MKPLDPSAMQVGELTPLVARELDGEEHAAAFTLASRLYDAEHRAGWKSGLSGLERGNLAELAVTLWLWSELRQVAGFIQFLGDVKRHPVDIIIWQQGKPVEVGVKSTEHSKLVENHEAGRKPYVLYPERRFPGHLTAAGDLPEFLIAPSVQVPWHETEDTRNWPVQVAIWGAITRDELKQGEPEWRTHHLKGLGNFKGIWLDAFRHETLRNLVDKAEPAKFGRP